MRVALWHGWLLEGSGSNVATAKTAEALVAAGHDVLVLCQEPQPERLRFVRAAGTVGAGGVSGLRTLERTGRITHQGAVVLRPEIGSLLPVFVIDEYPGFTVKRFPDLGDDELERYLDLNAAALQAAVTWHRSEALVAGHVVPGGPVVARAGLPLPWVVQTHGSDIEYALREDDRYGALARSSLAGAVAVAGSSMEVLQRLVELVPSVGDRTRPVPPGVDIDRFRLRSRREALETAASFLDPAPADHAEGGSRGNQERPMEARSASVDDEVRRALAARDAGAMSALAHSYDQTLPDPDAARTLRGLAQVPAPMVGYFGKLIAAKGPHLFLTAVALLPRQVRGLVVGFGLDREWVTALSMALHDADDDAVRWVCRQGGMDADISAAALARAGGLRDRLAFTGRLDHRFAPYALAAMDVLVVPSVVPEAFGLVAAEGAAAGALPLVTRAAGLEEVALALEEAAGRPGLFSFEPGPGAPARIAEGIARILTIPRAERLRTRDAVSSYVADTWTWDRTAERLLSLFRNESDG